MFRFDPQYSVFLNDETDETVCQETMDKITELSLSAARKRNKPRAIYLIISSGGGQIEPALAFYDYITYILKPDNLQTISLGRTDSAAILIFLAGRHRLMTPNSTIFFHELSYCNEKGIEFKTSQYHQLTYSLVVPQNKFAQMISKAVQGKMSSQKVLAMMKKETYLCPQEAIQYGLAHEILS
ncbi:MAG: ATP-dependent Clp protease proteolytic subunit [Parcubacteria group bacterium]|nr:ATP-dependent Clp protease proteolytic subunit [Parcubacteria group bacterium]